MSSKSTKPKGSAQSPDGQARVPATRGQQARAARKRQVLADVARRRRRARLTRWGVGILGVAAAVGVVAWLALGGVDDAENRTGGLPGPRGGASVAQDVNTLVGMPAPAFTLADSEGTSYTVTPGRGRPIVLVFHMGIT